MPLHGGPYFGGIGAADCVECPTVLLDDDVGYGGDIVLLGDFGQLFGVEGEEGDRGVSGVCTGKRLQNDGHLLAWLSPWGVKVDDCERGHGKGLDGGLEDGLVYDLAHGGHDGYLENYKETAGRKDNVDE